MAREQVATRISFDAEQRKTVLDKSNYKCSHCGASLTAKDVTIDHFIPLSKGGRNIPANLTGLCIKCNEEKDNIIVRPHEYYKFVKNEYLKELDSLYEAYLTDKEWLTNKNYTKDDYFTFKYPTKLESLQGKRLKKRGDAHCVKIYMATATIKKAAYEDMEEIREFSQKCIEKAGTEYSIDKLLSSVFMTGAIYMIQKSGILTAVILIQTVPRKSLAGRPVYMLSVRKLLWLYQNENNMQLLLYAIKEIFKDIADLNGGTIAFEMCPEDTDEFWIRHCEQYGIKSSLTRTQYVMIGSNNTDQKSSFSKDKAEKYIRSTYVYFCRHPLVKRIIWPISTTCRHEYIFLRHDASF